MAISQLAVGARRIRSFGPARTAGLGCHSAGSASAGLRRLWRCVQGSARKLERVPELSRLCGADRLHRTGRHHRLPCAGVEYRRRGADGNGRVRRRASRAEYRAAVSDHAADRHSMRACLRRGLGIPAGCTEGLARRQRGPVQLDAELRGNPLAETRFCTGPGASRGADGHSPPIFPTGRGYRQLAPSWTPA